MESLQLLIQVHTELSDIEAKVKKMKQIISTHLETAAPAMPALAPEGGPLKNKPGEPSFQLEIKPKNRIAFKSDKLLEEAVHVDVKISNPTAKHHSSSSAGTSRGKRISNKRLHSKSNNQDLMSVSPLEGEKQKKKKKHQDQASTSAFSQQRDIYENRETIDAFAPPIRFPPKPQKQREEEEEAEEHVYAEF